MKISVLIENKPVERMKAEHGLAVHISWQGREYLLDTGASDQFLENARRMGIDISKVDTAILSHGHYDHAGGYGGFFAVNQKTRVYLRREALEPYYVKGDHSQRYIGVPEELAHRKERLAYVRESMELEPGVWLILHSRQGMERKGEKAHMYRKTEKGFIPDDFCHEQSLVFNTPQGLVILNSCCHGGAAQVVEEASEMLTGKPILALVGGFHLMGAEGIETMGAGEEEVRQLASQLISLGVKQIYTGHCTGLPAYDILKEELGDRLHYMETGTVITL